MFNFKRIILLAAVLVFTGSFGQALAHFENQNRMLAYGLSQVRDVFYQGAAQDLAKISSQDLEILSEKVSPSVVFIQAYQKSMITEKVRIRLPFGRSHASLTTRPITKVSSGTGFFATNDGYILTSLHVVADSSEIKVVLSDESETAARLVYQDPDHDIAILKIEGQNFPAATLGDSSKLKSGQSVFSMGNALGLFSNLVSSGEIVSTEQNVFAGNLETQEGQTINNAFRFSAQLYPGQSGGPTFNLNGEVVGINAATAINRENISFAVPINPAKQALQQALTRENNQYFTTSD